VSREATEGTLRRSVRARAHGRCEYCLIDEADAGLLHEIDYIISRKYGGSSTTSNLAFACYLCNRYKVSEAGSISPATGKYVPLFHPRQDRWEEHFRIAGPIIEPITATGATTIRRLRLNARVRVIERQMLQSLGRYPRRQG
jgi:hypothetical protein